MSWAPGHRAIVLPDNVYDDIDEGRGRERRWAGTYGHVTGAHERGMVSVRLEGNIHGQMPEGHARLKHWVFLHSEVTHAD
jgi:hypothetical protein